MARGDGQDVWARSQGRFLTSLASLLNSQPSPPTIKFCSRILVTPSFNFLQSLSLHVNLMFVIDFVLEGFLLCLEYVAV